MPAFQLRIEAESIVGNGPAFSACVHAVGFGVSICSCRSSACGFSGCDSVVGVGSGRQADQNRVRSTVKLPRRPRSQTRASRISVLREARTFALRVSERASRVSQSTMICAGCVPGRGALEGRAPCRAIGCHEFGVVAGAQFARPG